MNKWDLAYMDVAFRFSELSSAERLKVGAIIVKDNRIISIGYNGTPSGWSNVCEDENNVTKPEVIHAEENCISKVARSNEGSLFGAMYLTHAPCINCSKMIYSSGISKLFFRYKYRSTEGLEFLEKCKIEVNQI